MKKLLSSFHVKFVCKIFGEWVIHCIATWLTFKTSNFDGKICSNYYRNRVINRLRGEGGESFPSKTCWKYSNLTGRIIVSAKNCVEFSRSLNIQSIYVLKFDRLGLTSRMILNPLVANLWNSLKSRCSIIQKHILNEIWLETHR